MAENSSKKKFQNLTIDYTDIVKNNTTVKNRQIPVSTNRSLLNTLTPTQMSEMFPTNTSRNKSNISDPTSRGIGLYQRNGSASLNNNSSSSSGILKNGDIGTGRYQSKRTATIAREDESVKKVMDSLGLKSDPASRSKLNSDQEQFIDDLRKGNISSTDPRSSFLSKLNTDTLKRAGIERTQTSDGKMEYKYIPVSKDELQSGEIKSEFFKKGQGQTAQELNTALMARGFNRLESSAIIGNLSAESNFNSSAVNPTSGAHGLMQWLGSRKQKLIEFARSQNGDINSRDLQLDFIAHELRNDPHESKQFNRAIQESNGDPGKAGYLFGKYVERPSDDDLLKSAARRSGVASSVYKGSTITEDDVHTQRKNNLSNDSVQNAPEGINSKVLSIWSKLSSGDKQRLTEMYNLDPVEFDKKTSSIKDAAQAVSDFKSQDSRIAQLQKSQAGIRKGELSSDLSDKLEYAARKTNVYAEVVSGGQRMEGAEGATGSHRHDSGQAGDLDLYTKDDKGNKTYLHIGNPEHKKLIGDFLKYSMEAGATGLAVGGPGYMDVQGRSRLHIGGGSPTQWGPYSDFVKQQREEADRLIENNKKNSFNPVIDMKNKLAEESKKMESPVSMISAEEKAKEYAKNMENSPFLKARNKIENNQISPESSSDPVQSSSSIVKDNNESLSSPVEVFNDGGKKKIDNSKDNIKALPIKSIKNDNSLVVDDKSNPMFTMNTKEESAKYDPKTRQVEVNPVTKTDPNSLKQTEQLMNDMTFSLDKIHKQHTPTQSASHQNIKQTENRKPTQSNKTIFQDPSFERAMAKTRFSETGSAALGGHFSTYNSET